jgi:surface protein
MSFMFMGADAFNQPLNNWDTSSISDLEKMFFLAEAFDQDLSSWDVSNVSNMESMLSLSGISESNYDNILIGWSGQNVLNNVYLGAENLVYCNSYNERQSLIDNFGWNFVGDQISSNCSFSTDDFAINLVKIYPNPVSDVLVIDGINELYDIKIFDIHGKKIMSAYKANTLKLNSLNTGIYLLKVFDDSSTHNFKIVKD